MSPIVKYNPSRELGAKECSARQNCTQSISLVPDIVFVASSIFRISVTAQTIGLPLAPEARQPAGSAERFIPAIPVASASLAASLRVGIFWFDTPLQEGVAENLRYLLT